MSEKSAGPPMRDRPIHGMLPYVERLFREAGLHFTHDNMIALPASSLADDFEMLEGI